MNKKILISILVGSFILTGCFGSDGSSPASQDESAAGFHSYASNEFRLDVADDWETLTPTVFKSDTPANTVIAFKNNIRNPRFTANVAVVKNTLSQSVPTTDYAKALYQKTSDELTSFKEILTEETKILVSGKETKTIFRIVEGRESPEKDTKRFFQITGVKGKNAFIAIGSMLATDDEATAKKLETMVRSFEVK